MEKGLSPSPPPPDQTHPHTPHGNTGANDAALPPSQQYVPLDAYKENLERMVHFFRRLSNRHREVAVLLVTPPPLHEQDWEAFLMVRAWLACMHTGGERARVVMWDVIRRLGGLASRRTKPMDDG